MTSGRPARPWTGWGAGTVASRLLLVLLVPTLLTPPPPYGLLNQPRGTTRAFFDVEFATTGWTSLANVTGWAAISLPLGQSPDGLPLGVQLMAPGETILLQLAAQLEAAAPWADRRPPDR